MQSRSARESGGFPYEVLLEELHAPQQVLDHAGRNTGRWAYTCSYAGRSFHIGYCSKTCFHLSPEEAEEHYRAYVLDTARFDGHWAGVEYRCELCGAWTSRFAQTDVYALFRLCPMHLNRAGLEAVLDLRAGSLGGVKK